MKLTLPPIEHRDAYTRAIERQLLAFLKEVIFDPLFDILGEEKVPVRKNARETKKKPVREDADTDVLRDALILGTLWYADGTFYGQFNAPVSRRLRQLGARPDGKGEGFHLEQALIPFALRSSIIEAKMHGEAVHKEILRTLDAMSEGLPYAETGINVEEDLATIEADLQKQFVQTAKEIEDLVITPVPENVTTEILEQTTTGIDYNIKGFAEAEIARLREMVQANLATNARVDRLAQLIEAQFGVSKRRAAFIAENETSLAVAKFREARYKEIGVTSYIWSTSHDERVRHDHQLLEGKTFDWSSPPIVDQATGRRGHPGEDFNCRCVPLPILNA